MTPPTRSFFVDTRSNTMHALATDARPACITRVPKKFRESIYPDDLTDATLCKDCAAIIAKEDAAIKRLETTVTKIEQDKLQ